MTVFILANPNAGAHLASKVIKQIQKDYADLEMAILLTQGPDDEKNQVEQLLKLWQTTDKLLIVGGDGTLSKVLFYLPEFITFAYFPVGSGNDFARALKLPNLSATMENLLQNRVKEINVFASETGILLNSLDLGFAAWVVQRSQQSFLKPLLNRLHLGSFVYIVSALFSLLSRPSASLTLEKEDGKELVLNDKYFFSLANNTYFGGGIMIWPSATVFSSQLDLVYAKGEKLWQRIGILLSLVLKRHQRSSLFHHERLKSVRIHFAQGSLIEIDGEIVEAKNMTLQVQTRKIYL